MESRNHTSEAPDVLDAGLEHTRPAQPDEPDSGFADGVAMKPDKLKPDFARGIRGGRRPTSTCSGASTGASSRHPTGAGRQWSSA